MSKNPSLETLLADWKKPELPIISNFIERCYVNGLTPAEVAARLNKSRFFKMVTITEEDYQRLIVIEVRNNDRHFGVMFNDFMENRNLVSLSDYEIIEAECLHRMGVASED
jgi:hypothetical protein